VIDPFLVLRAAPIGWSLVAELGKRKKNQSPQRKQGENALNLVSAAGSVNQPPNERRKTMSESDIRKKITDGIFFVAVSEGTVEDVRRLFYA
jgi:hypothetical protein